MALLDAAGIDRAKKLASQNGFNKLKDPVKVALIVNAAHESGINPSAVSGDGGGGIWQWTPYAGKIVLGDWQGQVDFMLKDASQYIAHSGWWANAGIAEPASMANVNSWQDFLNSNASAEDLTISFIGNWERPAYTYGAQRVASAAADVAEIQKIGFGGTTLQIPQWPMADNLPVQFTQGPFQFDPSASDHDDFASYDVQPQDTSIQPLYAPVDLVTTYAQMLPYYTRTLVSQNQIQFADGTIGYLGMVLAHSSDPSLYVQGKKFSQGEVFGDTAGLGISTGHHFHMSIVNLGADPNGLSFHHFTFQTDIIGDARGNVDGGGETWPNPYITKVQAEAWGMMTWNNVFSVTDKQKANMRNVLGAHVNIDAFHFVAGPGTGGGTPGPPNPASKPKHSRGLSGAAIFNVTNFY